MTEDQFSVETETKSNLLSLSLKNHHVGKVHSKFNKGLNVQFDDILIYIGCSGTSLSSFGLNIEKETLKSILNSVQIDNMVVNKEETLIFYGVDRIINICYKNLIVIDLKLPKIKCSLREIEHSQLYKYLDNLELAEFVGIPLDERTNRYIQLLLNSDKSDWTMNVEIIRFFIGRGKGLTPSGDDILLGFTLALMTFGSFHSWQQTLMLEVTGDRTTIVSVAYLHALLRGYASEFLIQLIKLLDHVESGEIEKTITKTQSFGHTSGNDTLFGFFLGLKFLTNQGEG